MTKVVTLEFKLEDLIGAKLLLKVKEEAFEGVLKEIKQDLIRVKVGSEDKWLPVDSVEVVTILFR